MSEGNIPPIPRPKKPVSFGKVLMIGCGGIIGVFILIFCIALAAGLREAKAQAQARAGSSHTGATPSEAEPVAAVSAERTAKVGETFTLGKFKYTITDRRAAQSVGNQFVNEAASAGATFVIVSYTIENIGNETATAMTSDFHLVDADGRKFQPASRAETALAMSAKNQDMILSQLQPGIPKATKQVFEIPMGSAQKTGLKLIVPEKGFLGSGTVTIPMNY